jgi:hypothetical protein
MAEEALTRREGITMASRLPTQAEIEIAVAGAKKEDESRSAEGAILALSPCSRHCTICDGDDHHWIIDCDDEGDPIVVCKHCPAWREPREGDEGLSV